MSKSGDPDFYKPGDVVYYGEPFIRTIRHDLWDNICAGCLESDNPLKTCAACGIMKYCGKICQKKAWKDHKLECPYLRNYTDFRKQEYVQMIGNIILKIKGRDWKTVTERVLDKEVSFHDLVSHTGTEHGHDQIKCFAYIKDPLLSYIGKENMPDDKTLKEIFGKILFNSFGFIRETLFSEEYEGWCIFLGASKFDHSCVPNSFFKIDGISIVVRAIQPIHKKLEKVTFSYGSFIEKAQSYFLNEELKRSFGTQCYCEDCSQPFGHSPLTKIIDETKAETVLEDTKKALLLVPEKANLNGGIVDRGILKKLLKDQEGVLGSTNLLRMQTLALRNLFVQPRTDMCGELTQLADAMVEVWGEYNTELLCVYRKLIKVHMDLKNRSKALDYAKKMYEIRTICFGREFTDADGEARNLCDLIHQNRVYLINSASF